MQYTQYKLSERQLKVLSQIQNNRLRNLFQPTLDVLMRHGLIVYRDKFAEYSCTGIGAAALGDARRAGW